MPTRLHLPTSLRAELWAHAQADAPRECVGVLGGHLVTSGTSGPWAAQVYLPLLNVAGRPNTEYLADPGALIRALRGFRSAGLELVGIVHSHPCGPDQPSATDRAAAAYDVPYLIADLSSGALRAFLLPSGAEVQLRP